MKSFRRMTLIALGFSLLWVQTGFAGTPATKLGRGAKTIVTAPSHLAHHFVDQYSTHFHNPNPLIPYFVVPITSVAMTVAHIAAGAVDIATFFLPIPGNYEATVDSEVASEAVGMVGPLMESVLNI